MNSFKSLPRTPNAYSAVCFLHHSTGAWHLSFSREESRKMACFIFGCTLEREVLALYRMRACQRKNDVESTAHPLERLPTEN